MILYTVVTAVVLLLSYFVCKRQALTTYGTTRRQALSRACLIAVFMILFLLSALRMEVGNDYKNYAVTCHEIWVNGYVVTEIGFNYLVKLIYAIVGYENYIYVFAVFAFATSWIFLKVFYRDSDNFFLSMMLFMLLGLYFRTFNTVRYYFALAAALYSLRYVIKKQYIKFIIIICVTALLHKSVLFVIPVYLAAVYVSKKWHYIVLVMAGIVCAVGKDVIMKIALLLYPSYKNTPFLNENGGMISNIVNNASAIGRCILVLVLCLVFYKSAIENNKANKIYFNLNNFALLLYVCGYFLPLLSRFTYYMTIPQLLLVPGVITSIQEPKKKKVVLGIVIAVSIIYFILFLKTAAEPGIRVLPYKTWIMEGLQEYIYANEVF